MAFEVGSVLEGTVTGITKFGAFVELPDKKVGLVHISEVANEYVKDVNDFLKIQDKVSVKVLSVDEKGKIGLSIKQTKPAPPPREPRPQHKEFKPRQPYEQHGKRPFDQGRRSSFQAAPVAVTFEDRLSKFLKDSDERLTDLKRNTESKRGGRGARRSD